jgi:hypothetical protein
MQSDGKVVVGGMFDVLAKEPRHHLGRLQASEPATQSLAWNGSNITWRRGGTSPAVCYTTFEASNDSGANWLDLGTGSPISGGWQLDWQLPGGSAWDDLLIRARGYVSQGRDGSSGWFVENFLPIVRPPPVTLLLNGDNFGFHSRQFGFAVSGPNGAVVVVEASSDLRTWNPLVTNRLGSDSLMCICPFDILEHLCPKLPLSPRTIPGAMA